MRPRTPGPTNHRASLRPNHRHRRRCLLRRQVQVINDILATCPDYTPRHARTYASVGSSTADAIARYRDDVRGSSFPTDKQSFTMDPSVLSSSCSTPNLPPFLPVIPAPESESRGGWGGIPLAPERSRRVSRAEWNGAPRRDVPCGRPGAVGPARAEALEV